MFEKLIQIGLTPKEASVYLALLVMGSGGVSAVAVRAKINRTTAYDVLRHLVEVGLVSESPAEKKKAYLAEPPEKIPGILEERAAKISLQAKAAEYLVSELKLLSGTESDRPRIRFFEGIDGVKAMYEDSLLSQEAIRSFNSTAALEGFDSAYLHRYYARRAIKNIAIRALVDDTPLSRDYQKEDPKLKRQIMTVPKEKMDIKTEVYIYDNKIGVFSLREKFGVLIESSDIAESFKKLYDLAWKHAEGLNQGIKK